MHIVFNNQTNYYCMINTENTEFYLYIGSYIDVDCCTYPNIHTDIRLQYIHISYSNKVWAPAQKDFVLPQAANI